MQQEIVLKPRPPYDFDLSMGRLGTDYPDPIRHFIDGAFTRLWPVDNRRDLQVSVTSTGTVESPELKLLIDGDNLTDDLTHRCAQQVSDALCLDLDLESFYRKIKKDKVLYDYCMGNIGLRPILNPTLFEAITWAITGQQINLHFACTVKRGMLERYAPSLQVDGMTFYSYPDPSDLAGLDPASWKEFKSSQRKAEYIIGLAEKVENGFNLEALHALPDDEIIEKLVTVRGIGQWTAEYVLIMGFGRFDSLPVGDAGLLNGYRKLYGLDRKPDREELIARAEHWRPYRGLATYYIWWGKS